MDFTLLIFLSLWKAVLLSSIYNPNASEKLPGNLIIPLSIGTFLNLSTRIGKKLSYWQGKTFGLFATLYMNNLFIYVSYANWWSIHEQKASNNPSINMFFTLTYLLSWAIWIPLDLAHFGIGSIHIPEATSNIVRLLGVLMPAVSALILTAIFGGRNAVRTLLGRLAIWRVGWSWWAAAVLVQPILLILAGLIYNVMWGNPLVTIAPCGCDVILGHKYNLPGDCHPGGRDRLARGGFTFPSIPPNSRKLQSHSGVFVGHLAYSILAAYGHL